MELELKKAGVFNGTLEDFLSDNSRSEFANKHMPLTTMTDVEKLVHLLKKRGQYVTTVESCTGGAIAARIVDVPGASDVLKEAFVTYCDEAKHTLVGVKKKTLKKHTAVSPQVAKQMARGGAKTAGADLCLSATGVAGPSGTEEFPAGLVYLGCFYKDRTIVKKYNFTGSRNVVRVKAVEEAVRLGLMMLASDSRSMV